MGITVESATKRFGDFVALDEVSIEVPDGSLTALLGPSGSGKSTLLRVIAGLEEPDSGRVLISEQEMTHVSVQDRNVGFCFQHYAAFKHMTVGKNVAFGLDIRKRPKQEINDRVHELLKLVQLEGLIDRYPSQLSGGQRQRMALARALAVEPKVLLLDEPFGALDARVRTELRRWLRRLHEEVHVTTICSATSIASYWSWVTKIVVTWTSSWRRRSHWRSSVRTRASRAPNGSSSSSTFGSTASARASAIRWRWPPESCDG